MPQLQVVTAPSPQAPTSEEQVVVSQSRDLIEDVFMNTAASVILKVVQARCECDETFQMECMKLIGSQPNRVFADENQPARRKETHARVNSQDLTRKPYHRERGYFLMSPGLFWVDKSCLQSLACS
jgi:hypothetical protein